MLTNVTYERAREEMAGGKTRGLRSHYPDLRKALVALGAEPVGMPVRAACFEAAEEISIFGVKRSRDRKRWHWVIYDPSTGCLHDPMLPEPLMFNASLNKRYLPFSRQTVRRPSR